jgi:Sortilin, neurotensin receptor 3,/Sortilin, neurotensin receptor 3, C-terminal
VDRMLAHRMLAFLITSCMLIETTASQQESVGQIRTGFEVLDGPIVKILWCGESTKGNRLLLSNRGTVYTSADHGFNWISLKPTLQASTFVAGGKTTGVVRSIIQNPVNPALVLLQGRKGVSWASNNCGKNIKVLRHGKRAFRFQFHPQFANFLLGGFLPNSPQTNRKLTENSPLLGLWLSKDWGESWVLLRREVMDFGWASTPNSSRFDTIVALVRTDSMKKYSKSGKLLVAPRQQYFAMQDDDEVKLTEQPSKYQVVVSDDYFKTEWVIKQNANRLIVLPHYIYATSLTESGMQLFMADLQEASESAGESVSSRPLVMYKADFPAGSAVHASLTFAHTGSLRVCVASGDLYCSDSHGRSFSKTVPQIRRNQFGMVDFVCLQGLEGVCLANNATLSYRRRGWNAPWMEIYVFGCQAHQKSECRLFVHSVSDLFSGKIISSASAPGLVIVSGETQKYGEGVYISQDGAENWRFLAKGKHIFNFADQGGLILLAPTEEPTDSISFSWDYGLSFVSLKFSQERVYLVRIHSDKHKKGVFFFLEGLSHGGLGLSIPLDFSFLMPRKCEDDDFETWAFDSSVEDGCFNGIKPIFWRRKFHSNCFIPDKMELSHLDTSCVCSNRDLECTPGLRRIGTLCGIIDVQGENQSYDHSKTIECLEAPPKNCEHSYKTRLAYRKARDSQCIGSISDDSRIELCPAHKIRL